jgi:hypothetical protein
VRTFDVILIEFAMRARGKNARDICMTFHARGISDIMSAFDLRGGHDRSLDTAARSEKSDCKGDGACEQQGFFTRCYACQPARHPGF